MTKVAVIGIQGVPAHYGGFESLIENLLGNNRYPDIEYTVFCSSADIKVRKESYKGAKLKYIPIHANGIHSVPYDIVSMIAAARGYDVLLILGVSGCMFLPIIRKVAQSRIIVNIDGLEYKREKWGKLARWLLKHSEAMAVKHADIIIADNKGIQDYVREEYGKESELIAYGGEQAVKMTVNDEKAKSILDSYGLSPRGYAITVCRIEPENNPHVVLETYKNTGKPLVFIGNWNRSEWSKSLRQKYMKDCPNLHLLDAIYDLEILWVLRANAAIYLHGHSAGGTNPSLVEAMHFGVPIAAWDVVYNRETTENKAYYFKSPEDLALISCRDDLDGAHMKEIAQRRYTWDNVSLQYCRLFTKPLHSR